MAGLGNLYWGSMGQGITDAQSQLQNSTMKDLEIQMRRQALAESLREDQAQQQGEAWAKGLDLNQYFQAPGQGGQTGQQAPQPPMIPPPPGTPSQSPAPQQGAPAPAAMQPGAPPPGMGPRIPPPPQGMPGQMPPAMQMQPPMAGQPTMPGMMQPQPQMAGAAPQIPAQPGQPAPMSPGAPPGAGPRAPGQMPMAPYMAPRPMPAGGSPGIGSPGGAPQIGAPPQQQQGQPGQGQRDPLEIMTDERQINVPKFLNDAMKAGVKFHTAIDMLKQLEGAMSPEQKAQAKLAEMQMKYMQLQINREKADTQQKDEERKRIMDVARREKMVEQNNELRSRSELEQERIRQGKIKVQAGGQGATPLGKTGLSVNAMDLDAYTRLFWKTYPPGYGKDAIRIKMEVDNRAAQLAKDAGLTMSEAAGLKGEKQAYMASLVNMTRWYDGVKKSSMAVENNIGVMKQWAGKLDLTQSQDLNQAIVAIRSKFGDEAAQNYKNAAMEVMNEYARVMTGPTSNAQLAEGATQRAQEIINTSFSPEQLEGAQKVMTDIMNGQLKATEDTIRDRKADLKSLGPSTREGSTATAAPASAPKAAPKVGDVHDGYRFKGGDPSKKENWEKV